METGSFNTLLAAVNALSVVVLVAVTVWYAKSTARMMESMRQQSELLAKSVEIQALLAQLQAETSTVTSVEGLKRVKGITYQVEQIRSGLAPTQP